MATAGALCDFRRNDYPAVGTDSVCGFYGLVPETRLRIAVVPVEHCCIRCSCPGYHRF